MRYLEMENSNNPVDQQYSFAKDDRNDTTDKYMQ